MLWRVRASLPDRPGFLARVARACGEAGVNILSLQIFPGVGSVTDELVVRTPSGWRADDLRDLVVASGGDRVVASPCSEVALVDQPTRHVQAARAVLAAPQRLPEVLAGLLDGRVAEGPPQPGEAGDTLVLRVAGADLGIHRTAPFTAAEHARAAAFAELVDDLMSRAVGAVLVGADRRWGAGTVPELHVVAGGVRAVAGGVVVGSASMGEPDDPGGGSASAGAPSVVVPVELVVDVAWRRRGVGSRLLREVSRMASGAGATDVRLTTSADDQAVLPMVLAAGLRGRVRVSGGTLTVVIGVRELARPRH